MDAVIGVDDVGAVIVTRGDCDLSPILDSLIFKDVTVWDNSVVGDQGAFGRYIGILLTARAVIFVQDDDCIITPEDQQRLVDEYEPGVISALMPPERIDYHDTVLIGWGAMFDWNMPAKAFARWRDAGHEMQTQEFKVVGCDFVFPLLSLWKRLDAYHVDLPHAHAPNRTWGSWPRYAEVKERYLREGRAIRDSGSRSRHR